MNDVYFRAGNSKITKVENITTWGVGNFPLTVLDLPGHIAQIFFAWLSYIDYFIFFWYRALLLKSLVITLVFIKC